MLCEKKPFLNKHVEKIEFTIHNNIIYYKSNLIIVSSTGDHN